MKIRAALLDEHGVFLRMDELADASQLTERHLPTITECDLPPGEYIWIAHGKNRAGGTFLPLEHARRMTREEQESYGVEN